MDDYSISSLVESKNEWCARLVSILSNTVITGIMSIFKEAITLCEDNEGQSKYLMTFQNLLSRIPQWNPSTIEAERIRIETDSRCKYIEDLITCVHVIQLKALTCVRVGQKQKKIDLDIPSVDKFIHQIYINCARKLYTNIYLFEKDILPLQIQKNNRELELLVKESILLTIRNNIPVEQILKVYMDETDEQNVEVTQQEVISEKPKVKAIQAEVRPEVRPEVKAIQAEVRPQETAILTAKKPDLKLEDIGNVATIDNHSSSHQQIEFSDIDRSFDTNGSIENIEAPKTIERLNQISMENAERRKANEEDDDDDKLVLGDDINFNIEEIDLGSIEILK